MYIHVHIHMFNYIGLQICTFIQKQRTPKRLLVLHIPLCSEGHSEDAEAADDEKRLTPSLRFP